MSSATISRFPQFADGDVLVILDGKRIFKLHATILRNNSTGFKRLLQEEQGAKLTRRAKEEGNTVRWRLDLEWMGMGHGVFVNRHVDSNGSSSYAIPIEEPQNARPSSDASTLFRLYENMLRAFYNEPLELDGVSIMTSLQDCWQLVTMAETHGAINTVSARVDVALARHGKSLYRSIANAPLAWMGFACQIHSENIFREAMVHVMGRWNMLTDEEKMVLPPPARQSCNRKHAEFQQLKQAIEMRIAGHYPDFMHKRLDENPGRAQYANDIYSWIALSLFRHWFSQNVTDGTNFRAPDGGFRLYSLLHKGGKAYLDRQQCEAFHEYFPMTNKAKLVLENYLTVIKSEVRDFVRPMMQNKTNFEMSEGESFAYLVSVKVEENDYPWKYSDESDDGTEVDGLLDGGQGNHFP